MSQRASSRYVVFQDRSGAWRWRLVARNGRIVADGAEGYASRRNVLRAIAALAGVVEEAHRVEIRDLSVAKAVRR